MIQDGKNHTTCQLFIVKRLQNCYSSGAHLDDIGKINRKKVAKLIK